MAPLRWKLPIAGFWSGLVIVGSVPWLRTGSHPSKSFLRSLAFADFKDRVQELEDMSLACISHVFDRFGMNAARLYGDWVVHDDEGSSISMALFASVQTCSAQMQTWSIGLTS